MVLDEGERRRVPAAHVEGPADDDAGVPRQVRHLPGGQRLGVDAVLGERLAEDFRDFAGGSVLRAVGDEDRRGRIPRSSSCWFPVGSCGRRQHRFEAQRRPPHDEHRPKRLAEHGERNASKESARAHLGRSDDDAQVGVDRVRECDDLVGRDSGDDLRRYGDTVLLRERYGLSERQVAAALNLFRRLPNQRSVLELCPFGRRNDLKQRDRCPVLQLDPDKVTASRASGEPSVAIRMVFTADLLRLL